MSDDRNLRTYTRRGALGLMGIGGTITVSETVGFTNVTADRDTRLNFDQDDDALISLVGDDGDKTPLSESPQFTGSSVTITITNRLDDDLTVLDIKITNNDTKNSLSVTDPNEEFEVKATSSNNFGDSITNGSIRFNNKSNISSAATVEISPTSNSNISSIDFEVIEAIEQNTETVYTQIERNFGIDST